MAASRSIPADDIDRMLERYLGLVDEYTKLRASLTALQTSIYQNIARANFSAERGVRYGQDLFDERMQRSRSLKITQGEAGTPSFEVTPYEEIQESSQEDDKHEVDDSEVVDEQDNEKEKPHKSHDPLRWFGILTPMTLRQAQSQAIKAVEQIIPKLVTINAEMADVEIRVRRARKKRAKAEAAAVKQLTEEVKKVTLKEEAVLPSDKSATSHEKQPAPNDEKEAVNEDVTGGIQRRVDLIS